MKKVIILFLACVLIAPILSARDGHYWISYDERDEMSILAKLDYLVGLIDGLKWLPDSTGKLVEVLHDTALSKKKNIRMFVDMLDDFYGDYANLNIEILDALIFCLLRVKGTYDDDIAKEELRTLRKIYSETKKSVSLREKVIQDKKPYKCIRVIDGDTIVVKQLELEPYRLIGEEMEVQLVGIKCPVLNEEWRNLANVMATMYAEGEAVILSYEQTDKDIDGRTLAYVNIIGKGLLNELMIEGGNCRVVSDKPFTYIQRYKRLEVLAKLGKYGIWAEK